MTSSGLAVRTVEGRRSYILEGTATVLGDSAGAFRDLPTAPAPPETIAAFAATRFDPDGLDVGELLEQIVRQTGLRLIVLDPNSDHVGLRGTLEGVDPAVADLHRARGNLQILRADASLPFATTAISIRFSNFDTATQLLALRLDPVVDSDEVEALLELTGALPAPYEPHDIVAAAMVAGTPAARRLAVRIRALGIADWPVWPLDPKEPVLGDHLRSGESMVVDTGSVTDPAVRSAIAAGVLATVWAQRSERIPTLVVLDEAHHICPAQPVDPIQAAATEHAVLIAGEGRTYGIFMLVATQRPQKVHPSVVAGCESLVLLRMNSLRDVAEFEAAFSHVPEGLLRLAPGFTRGEAIIGAALVPAAPAPADRRPDHARGRRRRAHHLGASAAVAAAPGLPPDPRSGRRGSVRGRVAGAAQHATEVDDQLLVDVLAVRSAQRLGLGAERDLELAVVLFGHGADRLEQRHHLPPFDVAARRVVEDRLERVAVMVVQVRWREMPPVEVRIGVMAGCRGRERLYL